MPEKPSFPVLDKCNKCSSAFEGRAAHAPSPATHAETCCLYSLAHHGLFNDGFCQDCPGLTVRQQQTGPAHDPPETGRSPPQDGTRDSAMGSQPRKRKKIEPRLRSGFKKFTLELRPPKFKKKLWFGTYTAEEIDRAHDAVNYYMGYNQPYRYPDSPLIFASKPLKGIKFEDLQPSCDDYIQAGDGQFQLKHNYFARQVKDVIHSITGKQKKRATCLQKRNKCNGYLSPPPKLGLCDPITPSGAGAGSTTSSGTQGLLVASGGSQEIDSELSAMYPSFLSPPAERLPYEEEMFSELLRSSTQRDDIMGYTLEEMFNFPLFGSGDSSSMDEEDFPSGILWSFQNEALP